MKQRRIKVLQLGSSIGLYGAERWIIALVKYLDVDIIEAFVGAIKDQDGLDIQLVKEAKKLGINTVLFKGYGRFNFKVIKQLRNFIIKEQINIIHTHGYKTDIIGLCATIGTRCSIISTPHGWTNNPDWKLWLYEKIDRLAHLFFDAVVPLSKEIFEELSKVPIVRNKRHLILNGVDTSEIEEINQIAEEIISLKKDGKKVIGYVGRLISGKGLDTFLKAFYKYSEKKWTIAIVGEGDEFNNLLRMANEMQIQHRVKFYGYRNDRIRFINGFDVFVLPSRSEGIPRCLMEAMVAGVPSVASNIAGCRYLIDGKTTGLLFEPGNPKQLAESIKVLLSDKSLKAEICQNARKFIYNKYSARRMAKEYETLFQQFG